MRFPSTPAGKTVGRFLLVTASFANVIGVNFDGQGTVRDFARRRPLLVFVTLAYALSWAYWIPLALRRVTITPGGSESHFPGLLGPAIAAIITTALVSGRAGLRDLSRRFVLISRPPAQFWSYALSPVGFLGLAVLVAWLLHKLPRWSDFALFSGLPPLPLIVVLLLVLLFNGFGEEIGWRGYALPVLQARHGPLKSALIVALIWGLWHAPTFWTIEGYRSMSVPVLLGGFGIGLLCGSIVLTEVSRRTGGSVLAAALWHLTYNMGAATAASRGIIGAVTTAGVELWAVVIVVQYFRTRTAPQHDAAAA